MYVAGESLGEAANGVPGPQTTLQTAVVLASELRFCTGRRMQASWIWRFGGCTDLIYTHLHLIASTTNI
jgi:hypothetical protein